MTTLQIGDVTLTRVSYAEVDVEPEQVGLTADDVAAAGAPAEWVNGAKPRASASAWIIDDGDARIVVDPAGAVDDILRNENDAAAHQEAFAALLEAVGFPRETITHAVATHLDGVGMLAWRDEDGAWVPFFSNAPILMTQTELDGIDSLPFVPPGRKVLAELQDGGAVRGVADDASITSAVSFDLTAGHSPGHALVRIRSGGEQAIMVGHLALTPLHVGRVDPDGHVDLDVAMAARQKLLDEDAILIGPLWSAPAAGRWNGRALVPIAP
jgi:glyoxylase-like metal-dependent hydrolase (beta-lactamase superfamily II)